MRPLLTIWPGLNRRQLRSGWITRDSSFNWSFCTYPDPGENAVPAVQMLFSRVWLHYSHKMALILFQLRSSIWPRSRFLCVPQPSVRLLARCLSSSPPARRTKASCRTEDNCEAETGEFVGMWRGWHCFLFCCGTGRGEDTVEAERGLIRVLSCAQQKMLSLTRDSQSSF